jgi:hypothetical protein
LETILVLTGATIVMPTGPSSLLCHDDTGLQAELDAGAFVQVWFYRPVFMCVYLSVTLHVIML